MPTGWYCVKTKMKIQRKTEVCPPAHLVPPSLVLAAVPGVEWLLSMQLLAKHISLARKLGYKAEQAEAVQGSGLVGLSIPQPNLNTNSS